MIWCKFMHKILNIDDVSSKIIFEATNMWEEVYRNKDVYDQLLPNMTIHSYIFNVLGKYTSSCNKYNIYKITDNMFFSNESKEHMIHIFEKTQKMYFTLSKFVTFCKIKRSSVKVTTDLTLNEIALNDKNTISIYQNNAIYYFSVRDLINICNSALLFSYEFFAEPYIPKNPYTNIPFTNGILLKIYDSIRYSTYKIPVLFELFYRQQFNIESFVLKYEVIIRDECIHRFMKTGDIDERCHYIRDILSLQTPGQCLFIDKDFPKDVLIDAFTPILYNYLMSEYSLLSTRKRWEKRCIMKYMLYKFVNNNPTFGRKIITFRKRQFGCVSNKRDKKLDFISEYTPVDKNVTIPQGIFEAKEFFVYINEYSIASESDIESDIESNNESDTESNNESDIESNNESDIESDIESNIESINIITNLNENIDNILTPQYGTSNAELIMEDLFKNDSDWDDSMNDTDSVS